MLIRGFVSFNLNSHFKIFSAHRVKVLISTKSEVTQKTMMTDSIFSRVLNREISFTATKNGCCVLATTLELKEPIVMMSNEVKMRNKTTPVCSPVFRTAALLVILSPKVKMKEK